MRPTLPPSSLRGPRFWASLPALFGLALSMACTTSLDTNTCETTEDCAAVGTDARCEINNYCTYADPTCMGSGRRWEADADGALGGACFDPSQVNTGTSTGTGSATDTSTSTTAGATSSTTAADTSTSSTTTDDETGGSTGAADTEGDTDTSGSGSESGGGEGGSSEGGDTDSAAGSSGSSSSDSGEEVVYDAPEHCDEAFGDVPSYQGCSGDEELCGFSVSLIDTDYRNCRGLCASLGWSCADALHNPEGGGCEPTEGDEQGACDEEADDQICICAQT